MMPDRDKVINYLENEIIRAEQSVNDIWLECVEVKLLRDALALLKEQEEEIENLKQTAQSMMEGICLLKEQEAVVHPEPSCEMTYITDCCCDLCGVQLIREDNYCRCCGKRIEWEGR